MAQFFIGRPIFAWVVAIFIVIAGLIAIPLLPVAQYPNVAPPQISIYATYPGAAPEDMYRCREKKTKAAQVWQTLVDRLSGRLA